MGKEVRRLTVVLDANTRKLDQGLSKAGAGLKTLGGRVGKATAKTAKLSLVLGTVGAAFQAAKAIKTFAEFEQAIADVGAVTGAAGARLDEYKQKALELGRTTEFTATQAAEAELALSRAGFTTAETLAAVDASLLTASASGATLAQSTDVLVGAIRGFNLAASESKRVSDVLAKGANQANTDVVQLGEGLKFVAPVAAATNQSIERTVAQLGALSDAGLKGTLAGTGLRQSLAQLQAPTDKMTEVFEKLGIEFKDNEGRTKSLTQIIGELSDKGASTGDIMSAFGVRAGTAIQVLVARGVPDLNKMTEALEQSAGEAERMQKIRLDTISGQFRLMTSAADGFRIAFAGKFEPIIKKTIKALTAGFSKLTKSVERSGSDIAVFFLASADAMLAVAQAFTTSVGVLINATGTLIGAAIRAITLIPKTFGAVIGLLTQQIQFLAQRLGMDGLAASLRDVNQFIEDGVRFGDDWAKSAEGWGQGAADFSVGIDGARQSLLELSKGVVASQSEMKDALSDTENQAKNTADAMMGVGAGGAGDLAGGELTVKPEFDQTAFQLSIASGIAEAFSSSDIGGVVSASLLTGIELFADKLSATGKKVLSSIAPLAGELFNTLANFDPEAFSAKIEDLANSFTTALGNIGPFIATIVDNLDEIITALVVGIVGGIGSLIANIPSIVAALVNAVFDLIGQLPNRIIEAFTNIAAMTAEVFGGIVGSIGDKIRTFMDRVFVEGFRGLIDRLKNFFSDVIGDAGETFGRFMRENLEKFVNFWIGAINSLIGGLNQILPGFAEINKISEVSFNQGGDVPGPRVNRDVVPAMLTPGEHVLTTGQTDRFDRLLNMMEQGGIGGGGEINVTVSDREPGDTEDAVFRALKRLQEQRRIDGITLNSAI